MRLRELPNAAQRVGITDSTAQFSHFQNVDNKSSYSEGDGKDETN